MFKNHFDLNFSTNKSYIVLCACQNPQSVSAVDQFFSFCIKNLNCSICIDFQLKGKTLFLFYGFKKKIVRIKSRICHFNTNSIHHIFLLKSVHLILCMFHHLKHRHFVHRQVNFASQSKHLTLFNASTEYRLLVLLRLSQSLNPKFKSSYFNRIFSVFLG